MRIVSKDISLLEIREGIVEAIVDGIDYNVNLVKKDQD